MNNMTHRLWFIVASASINSEKAELIIEVAHPLIWKDQAENLLKHGDVLIGSPSGLSDKKVEDSIRQ